MKFSMNELRSLSINDRFLILGGISILLLLLILSPLSEFIERIFQQDELISSNKEYLKNILETDKKVLIQLAEIDALLHVLQSGEVGISFIVDLKVTIGNSLGAFVKIIDDALELIIVSISSITALIILSDFSEYASKILFVLLLIVIFLRSLSHILGFKVVKEKALEKSFIETLVLLFISFYLLVPYSIHIASFIEQDILFKNIVEQNKNLDNLHQSLIKNGEQINFKEKAKFDFKKFEHVSLDLTKKIESMTSYYVEKSIYILFRVFLIPIGIFLLLAYLLKVFILPNLKKMLVFTLLKEYSIESEVRINNSMQSSNELVNNVNEAVSRSVRRRALKEGN